MRLIVAATGHRPEKVGGYSDAAFNHLVLLAKQHLRTERPREMIVGMALGWDQAVAQACVDLDIPYTAAVPFEGQEELWPVASRSKYKRLLTWASRVEIVTERYTMPVARALQVRNEWMVDRCETVLALWDGTFGGTHNCILYAEKQRRPIVNLWEKFNARQAAD